jgi:iron(III) transport system substrate-binding protein
MKSQNMLVFLFVTLVSFLMAGCATAETPPVTPETSLESEAGSDPGALVIYSGRSESLVQPIIDQFKTATGIDVQVRYGSTPEMAGVLLEEGANSPADLFFAQDPGGLGAVQEAGLLQPLPDSILSMVPERFRAGAGEWVGISGRARVIAYNTQAIADPSTELPADIYDFIDPQWSDRLAWAPTNGSFQAMVTGMRAMWGEEKTRAWLQGVQANNPRVFEGNTPIVEAVASGEIDAGFVNHYYLYRFLAEQGEGFGARNYFLPGGGPGSLIMVAGAGILDSAENAENARRFIEFLLSLPGQQYFASQTFEYPVIEGVSLPASLPPLNDLDAIAPDISLTELADLEGTQDMLIELGIIE